MVKAKLLIWHHWRKTGQAFDDMLLYLKTNIFAGKQLSKPKPHTQGINTPLKQELPITTLLSRSEKQPIAPNELDLGRLLTGLVALQKIRKL